MAKPTEIFNLITRLYTAIRYQIIKRMESRVLAVLSVFLVGAQCLSSSLGDFDYCQYNTPLRKHVACEYPRVGQYSFK